jgi:dephospho-CoA kinase
MVLGLTGGMGCGKSTVGRLLEIRGLRRLDSDQIVRDRVLVHADVVAALRERFGERVVAVSGAVDRASLAEIVFADDSARGWLESLIHPRVIAAWQEAIASAPHARWVVEVPLLFEKGLEKGFDFTVCVACSPEQQFVRLEQRGLPRVLAGPRIAKQMPLPRKIELSDFVLWNEGSSEFLEDQVDRLVRALPVA